MRVRVKPEVVIPPYVTYIKHGVWYPVVDGFDLVRDCQVIHDEDGEQIIINADEVSICGHLRAIGGWEVDMEDNKPFLEVVK